MKKINLFTADEPDLGQRPPRIRRCRLLHYRLCRHRQVSTLSLYLSLSLSFPLFRPSLDLSLFLFSLREEISLL